MAPRILAEIREDSLYRELQLESSRSEAVAAGELGVRALGAAECHLHRPEALGLEPVAVVLVQLLIGLGETGSSEPEVVRRLRHGVEQLLLRLRGGVADEAGLKRWEDG